LASGQLRRIFLRLIRILTLSSNRLAVASACARGAPRERIGASMQFSRIVMCGKRLNCWNTIPTSRRTASIVRELSLTLTPSTMISPFWYVSSALMQRINVDLPDPDGPHRTIFSPVRTARLISVKTWNVRTIC